MILWGLVASSSGAIDSATRLFQCYILCQNSLAINISAVIQNGHRPRTAFGRVRDQIPYARAILQRHITIDETTTVLSFRLKQDQYQYDMVWETFSILNTVVLMLVFRIVGLRAISINLFLPRRKWQVAGHRLPTPLAPSKSTSTRTRHYQNLRAAFDFGLPSRKLSMTARLGPDSFRVCRKRPSMTMTPWIPSYWRRKQELPVYIMAAVVKGL